MKAWKSGWIPKWQAEIPWTWELFFFSLSRLKTGMTFLVICWTGSYSHPFPRMPMQGPIFIAEVSVSFSQYLWPSEIQIQEKKKCHQNSAGSNLPSLDFNLTTIHRKNPNMIFAADRKERECWELSRCLIALKPFPQKLKWWNSAWNVLGAFTHREMRWVNLLQLGAASPRPLCLST